MQKTVSKIIIILLFSLLSVYAKSAENYAVIDPQYLPKAKKGDKIKIFELFWYSCPHCYGFNNYVKEWEKTKAEDVEFIHVPAVFSHHANEHFAKAFYTAKALGVFDKMHEKIFSAFHNEKRRLKNADELMALFAENGISNEDFLKSYNSFGVDAQMRAAAKMTAKYGLDSVPTVVVNGKYRILGEKISGYKNILKLADELVDKERKLQVK
jgi:thiol:disulfide interchange protein DsbA